MSIIPNTSSRPSQSGEIKNAANRRYRFRHPDRQNKATQDWRRRHPEANMLHRARERANKLSLPFDITIEDIIIPDFCPVLGFPLEIGTGSKQDNSPSLDRIDNTKGYVRGNVVVVCWLVNRIKSNATVEQLKAVAYFYEAQASKVSPPSL